VAARARFAPVNGSRNLEIRCVRRAGAASFRPRPGAETAL